MLRNLPIMLCCTAPRMYPLCSTTIPIILELYLLIVIGPYYYMYVLWTLGKLALHNNIKNVDERELLPTCGTKQLTSKDRNYLTRELSHSLRRTQPFGIGWVKRLLLSCADVRWFVHPDLLLPHQIRLRWGSKLAEKRQLGLRRERGSGLLWAAASRLGLVSLDRLAEVDSRHNASYATWSSLIESCNFHGESTYYACIMLGALAVAPIMLILMPAKSAHP